MKDCLARSQRKNLYHSERRCWPDKYPHWGLRINSAECFVVTAEGVFRAREVRRIEHQDRWDKEAINIVVGVPWRIADGKCTGVQRGRESPEQTLRLSVPLQDARVAMRSDLESEHKLTQTPAEPGLRNASKQLQKVQSVQIEETRY